MVIVSSQQMPSALRVAGRLGFGRGYGDSLYGMARYGLLDPNAGIYQRRQVGTGVTLAPRRRAGSIAISRNRFYQYTITHTLPQEAWRSVFAAGKVQYDLLTTSERELLSKQARSLCMSGYNLFMSRWLQSHRS